MVLLSGQAVVIKDQKSHKRIEKWYYLDIEKCLNSNSDRRSAAALRRLCTSQIAVTLIRK
jgi:hypothetical protein